MSDFRDRFEQQLVEAAQRVRDDERSAGASSAGGRTGRLPRGLLAGLAAVATGIAFLVALASSPHTDRNGSSARVVANAPPREQLELLGVLRRRASPADRGPAAQAALKYVGGPVRKRFVRRLHAAEGPWVFLVPMREFRGVNNVGDATASARPLRDALCLRVSRYPRTGYTPFCFTTSKVRSGGAVGYVGRRRLALVPDGVAAVAVHRSGRRVDRVRVVDNFYTYGPPQGDGRAGAGVWVQWLDADGRPIPKGQ